MKRILYLLLIMFIITGCSVKKMDNSSYDAIINQVLENNIKLSNVSLDGYSYYLPKEISLYEKSDTNSVLLYKKNKVFLYVDIVSYYHKTEDTFTQSNNYYSKSIKYNDKFGYIEISKINKGYFLQVMYNYAKIEAYIKEENIDEMICNAITILSSIKYNDSVLDSLIGDNALNYNSEIYNIFEPVEDANNYLDWVDKYEDYTGEIKDEDSIEINESVE